MASNLRRNLDEALDRRLRFIIEFPLLDGHERPRIWGRIWPADTPRVRDLSLTFLARFEQAGACIRNIAVDAAFLFAAEREPVAQCHFLHATRRGYQKLGKMVDGSLFGMRS